jgi:hypothetical protein
MTGRSASLTRRPEWATLQLESAGEPALAHDSSTNTLIRRYRALREVNA